MVELLRQNVDQLKDSNPNITKILLFGSYARKCPHFGSDVDLLFIVSKRMKNDFEIIYETLFDLSTEYEWAPLVLSEERFQKLKNTHHHFFNNIKEEGIIIWSEN